jgi:hypothetical protein
MSGTDQPSSAERKLNRSLTWAFLNARSRAALPQSTHWTARSCVLMAHTLGPIPTLWGRSPARRSPFVSARAAFRRSGSFGVGVSLVRECGLRFAVFLLTRSR